MLQFLHGGWFPLAVALAIFAISSVWYWGQTRKGHFMQGNMIPLADVIETKPDQPNLG